MSNSTELIKAVKVAAGRKAVEADFPPELIIPQEYLQASRITKMMEQREALESREARDSREAQQKDDAMRSLDDRIVAEADRDIAERVALNIGPSLQALIGSVNSLLYDVEKLTSKLNKLEQKVDNLARGA